MEWDSKHFKMVIELEPWRGNRGDREIVKKKFSVRLGAFYFQRGGPVSDPELGLLHTDLVENGDKTSLAIGPWMFRSGPGHLGSKPG